MVASLLKLKAWIKAHWNWLVLVGLFCLAYIFGKKSSGTLLAQATLAKDQYKKEAEEIEKATRAKNKRDDKIDKKREEIKKALEQERENKLRLVKEQEINTDDVFQNLGIDKK
tara:strand:- start:1301 stop:1639 length:339 start_codon:yes stop_codon:yes gene_type:complete